MTLALLALGFTLTALGRWHGARRRPLGEVPLFPATLVLALGVVLVVVALAHLVSLLTGVHLQGRAAM